MKSGFCKVGITCLLMNVVLVIEVFAAEALSSVIPVTLKCDPSSLQIQVLGSGGPIADDGRASSGYLIWVEGKSRLMVDAGGGTFLRFGESKANYSDLDWIGLSHYHTDHSSDLAALLKSGYFTDRTRSLLLSGPDGNETFPELEVFVQALIGAGSSAYPYLSGYLGGSDGLHKLKMKTLTSGSKHKSLVFEKGDILVESFGVPHGIVPSLSYKISYRDKKIAFGSDQNGSEPGFVEFIQGVDALVMHMPVPESARGVALRLHAPPSVIGKIAEEAAVGQLILSHFMARSLRNLDENIEKVKLSYSGPIHVSNDLDCFSIK